MENLKKLAEHLICEADKIALKIAHDPSSYIKELDLIHKLCDAHADICESVEWCEKHGKHDDMSHRR